MATGPSFFEIEAHRREAVADAVVVDRVFPLPEHAERPIA
jgi:hypothetical protein